jgi:hypothetical protein
VNRPLNHETMTDLVKVKTALISVSDKTFLLELAAALKECGVQVRSPYRFCPFLPTKGNKHYM